MQKKMVEKQEMKTEKEQKKTEGRGSKQGLVVPYGKK